MRKIIILFFLLCPLMMRAAELKYLVITGTDGATTTFLLADRPLVVPDDNEFIVTCKGEDLTFVISEVLSFKFFDALPDAIHEVVEESSRPQLSDGRALFKGLRAGSLVSVFSSGGQQVTTVRADEHGMAEVHYSQLPAGVYILKGGNNTVKIIKK